jgi:hypothetical protein
MTIPSAARVFLVGSDSVPEIHAYYSEDGQPPEAWSAVRMVWEAAGIEPTGGSVPYAKWLTITQAFLTADGQPLVEHEFPEVNDF